MSHTKESAELKTSRAAYLEKIIKYRGLPMPATAHYTAGYKDGSAILWAVAQTCAEAEARLEEVTKQRDDLLAACDGLLKAHRITISRPPETVMQAEKQLDAIRKAVSVAEAAIASVKGNGVTLEDLK